MALFRTLLSADKALIHSYLLSQISPVLTVGSGESGGNRTRDLSALARQLALRNLGYLSLVAIMPVVVFGQRGLVRGANFTPLYPYAGTERELIWIFSLAKAMRYTRLGIIHRGFRSTRHAAFDHVWPPFLTIFVFLTLTSTTSRIVRIGKIVKEHCGLSRRE